MLNKMVGYMLFTCHRNEVESSVILFRTLMIFDFGLKYFFICKLLICFGIINAIGLNFITL